MSQVLEFVGTWDELAVHEPELRGKKLKLLVLPEPDGVSGSPAPTDYVAPLARELLKLPLDARQKILAMQAALLAEEYRTNPDLNCFEASGSHDFFDEYPERNNHAG